MPHKSVNNTICIFFLFFFFIKKKTTFKLLQATVYYELLNFFFIKISRVFFICEMSKKIFQIQAGGSRFYLEFYSSLGFFFLFWKYIMTERR